MESERIVFLHFLNREAYIAAGMPRDEQADMVAIDALALCHCSKLSVNISQMTEYSYGKEHLSQVLVGLAAAGIMITTSHESSISAFISSRQIIYRNVADRYPMYFANNDFSNNFNIAQANSFSMTRLLRRDILNFDASELNLNTRRARQEDIKIFSENLDGLQNVAMKFSDVAVTRANFELARDSRLTEPVLNSTARVFSAWYFDHYATHSQSTTCTGIGDVGYVEDLTKFPHYDVPILAAALGHLGWSALHGEATKLRGQINTMYGSRAHRSFVEALNAFLQATYQEVRSHSNRPGLDADSVESARAIMINRLGFLLNQQVVPEAKNLEEFFKNATETLKKAARQQSSKSEIFKATWELNVPPKKIARTLIATATDIEDEHVIAALEAAGFIRSGSVSLGQGFGEVYTLGTNKEAILVRSSAGSTGNSGAQAAIQDALRAIDTSYVVSIGICFGLKTSSQKLGDILVSDDVVDYESVRQSDIETRERGMRVPAGTKLLSAARIVKRQYATAEYSVHNGLFVSGQKLVDSRALVGDIQKRFPDAIGGEMEAVGITSAAGRERREWIVVKAICDWGYDKEKKYQEVAAKNAAAFAVKVINYVLDAEANAA